MNTKNKVINCDNNLVARVRKYLEENIDKTYLDVGIMAKQLQHRYPDYGGRIHQKFRKDVEQAYRVVSQSYGLDCQPSDSESDVEVMVEPPANNLMRNILTDLYQSKSPKSSKQSTPAAKAVDGAEAIDISSDEEDEDNPNDAGAVKNEMTTHKSPGGSTAIPTLSNITITKSNSNNSTTSNGNLKDVSPSQPEISINKRRNSSHQEQYPHPSKKFMGPQQNNQKPAGRQQEAGSTGFKGFRSGPNAHGLNQLLKQPQMKKYKKIVTVCQSQTTFQQLGGMEKTIKELCEILIHLKVPDIYYELGVVPPRGILLHGPTGCGKTILACAIAGQLELPIINVPATELIAGVSGESEERIRDIFEQANTAAPCVLFIDEIDAISSNRLQAQKDMERRIVSQLISSIDSLQSDTIGGDVLVIGATTRPDALDPALRRVGRFDHEIAIPIPNRKERNQILRVICNGLSLEPKFEFDKIAEITPGYVGADLAALAARAASIAVKKKLSQHMRALQKQRQITIVDLDDLDETAGISGASSGAERTRNTEKNDSVAGEKSNKEKNLEVEQDVEMVEVPLEKEPTDENNEGTDKSDNELTEEVDKSKDEEINKPANTNAEEKLPESTNETPQMNGDIANNEPNNNEASTPIEETPSKPATDEPTLAEMINWLDNPPEDFNLQGFFITLEDFADAVKVLQPSAKREGFITVPDVTWDDIGSLRDIREELRLAILAPVKFPEKMARLGLEAPSGVLLCGPPGCGKTLIAKAIANEAGINFISVKGPELMNMYVGESERAVRDCFQRARNSAPCVIFFDEFDSLCPKRSQGNDSSSGTRIVNQLLTEMDGIQERKGVYIMAATNRPDIIDPAIMRPGRLDTILYVGMPELNDRCEILRAATKNGTNPVLADDVDLMELARRSDGFTGADLAGLIRQAALVALKEALDQETVTEELSVSGDNLETAFRLARPSVSEQDRKTYEKLREKYAAPRNTAQVNSSEI